MGDPLVVKTAVFSTKPYDREYLEAANQGAHALLYFENRLSARVADMIPPCEALCVFVHDNVDRRVLEACREAGAGLVTLRCAGHNNVDTDAARELGIRVARVPAYSPHGVAEFAAGLLLTLSRKYHRAYNRIRERNFSLHGLVGFGLRGKTVGVIGTGKIGAAFARIMLGFGCEVIAYDLYPSDELKQAGVHYLEQEAVFARSDIVSLHCPLMDATRHLIRAETIEQMKPGVTLINTSRGGLIRTPDLIDALKRGHVGAVGLDVYEEEIGVFYEDLSDRILPDDDLNLLLAYPNVVVTSHQGFFTDEALREIAAQTVHNLNQFGAGDTLDNAVT